MTNRFHCFGIATLVVLFAGRSEAQITTVFTAPERVAAQRTETARRAAAADDSIARVTLTGMKEWVDSAANALAIRPDTGVAPATNPSPAADTPRTDSAASRSRAQQEGGDTFREGVSAPNTATDIPFLAMIGGGLIIIGALLRLRPAQRTAPERRSR